MDEFRRATTTWVIFGTAVALCGVAAVYALVVRPLQIGRAQLENYMEMQLQESILHEYRDANAEYPRSLTLGLAWWTHDRSHIGSTVSGADHWGHALVYQSDGQHFLLASLGRDGKLDAKGLPPLGAQPRGDHSPCRLSDADTIILDAGEDQACMK